MRFPAWVMVAGLCCHVMCGADPEISPELRDHVFFLGLDILVLQPEGFLSVEGYDRGNVKVSTDGVDRMVKLRKLEDVDSKIQPKVSSGSLVVEDVQGFRTYSPENDPTLKAVRTQSRMISDQMEKESNYQGALATELAVAQGMGDIAAASTDPTIANAARIAVANAETNTQTMGRAVGSMDSFDTIPDAVDDDGSNSDAYAVTCLISSEEPVENAYAVLVTNVLFPNASEPVRALAFEKLPVIDKSPRKIKFVQKWLPVGYGIEGIEIHTYRQDGSEIATNLSGKRAEVSQSEAFSFLLFRYVASNALENLPAAPVRELIPSDMHLYVPQGQGNREARLNIDEAGHVTDVHLEGNDGGASDSALCETLRKVYFYPALAFGEPVESMTTISLRDVVP